MLKHMLNVYCFLVKYCFLYAGFRMQHSKWSPLKIPKCAKSLNLHIIFNNILTTKRIYSLYVVYYSFQTPKCIKIKND